MDICILEVGHLNAGSDTVNPWVLVCCALLSYIRICARITVLQKILPKIFRGYSEHTPGETPVPHTILKNTNKLKNIPQTI